ncbi:MAG: DNA polymerase III subunit beta [Rhodothermia bacterium]|nr:DNA polymerase III subunit beta [Rhodothermia bacterium]
MRFTLSSSELLRALNMVAGAVPGKSTMPILECILLEKDGGRLILSATDLEISISQNLEMQFDPEASAAVERIAVPAKRLIETLRALPDLPVTFSSSEDYHVELKTDQGQYKMVGYDGADYPSQPQLAQSTALHTEGAILRRTFQKTSFAVSKDALRPAMMGVFFNIGAEFSEAVATDGHRLVRTRQHELKNSEAISFIVPEKALTLVGKIATDAPCTIYVSDGFIAFDFDDVRLVTRVIEERYPNYEAVIPKDNTKQLQINRAALLAAVKRVGLYSSSLTHQIRLSITQGEVMISAEDIERASEAKERILCEYNDESMEIGFNSVYLIEMLNNIDTAEVVMNFSSPNRAGVVYPSEQVENEEVMMLIMPVMLTNYN